MATQQQQKKPFPVKTALIVGGVGAVAFVAYKIFAPDEEDPGAADPPPTSGDPDYYTEEEIAELPITGYDSKGNPIIWTPVQYVENAYTRLKGANWSSYDDEINELSRFNRTQVGLVWEYWQERYYKVWKENFKKFLLNEVDGDDEYKPALDRLAEFGY